MYRRRLCLGAAAIALTLPLAGCMTVHGERENIPSVGEGEAARVLANFAAVNNRIGRTYDAKGVTAVESGALGTTDEAGLRAKHTNNPAGNPGYRPLVFSDSRYLIPRQVGWPKYFVADTATNRATGARWLLVFRRSAAGLPWKASYVASIATADLPEFARDKAGHPIALGIAGTDLLVQPGKLSAEYAAYLGGSGASDVFAEGPSTSQLRSDRNAHAKTANSVTQYVDQAASGGDLTPVALRTADGGALVFFASHHQSRATFRTGYKLAMDADTKALMTGTPRTSVTLTRLGDEAATVPAAGGGKVVFLSRVVGLVSAKGE
ncbi:hypothetical protein [Streptomyces sp. NPDC049040]|uniref:hypothetical protein n=1 Tax=Streptomyces sp. NPDC049040 TaxID=3365593 RepID=UPI003723FA2A